MSDIQRGKLPAKSSSRDDFETYAVTTSNIPLSIRPNTADYTPEPFAVIPSPNTAIPQHSDATYSERKTESPLGFGGQSSSSTPSTSTHRTPQENTLTSGNREGSKGQKPPTHKGSQDNINEKIRGYDPFLSPLVPTDIKRYERSITIPKRALDSKIIVEPLTLEFNSETLGDDWTRCMHPEGALYFYRTEGRVYTEANVQDPLTLAKIEKCIAKLYETHNLNASNDQQNIIYAADLVLEFWPDDDEVCMYYFAHHGARTLFWLEEYDLQVDLQEVQGEILPSHIKYAMEKFYWLHMGYFPFGHEFSPSLIKEIKCKLVWLLTDELTSLHSLSQFDAEKLKQLISVTEHLEKLGDDEYCIAIAGRLLNEFAWSYFLNYHGQHGARLNSNQSVHGEVLPDRSWIMAAIYLLLFNAPVVHLKSIHNVYTDGIVKVVTWKKHLGDLTSNWQEYVLYSTVLLNANVAFLDISNVTPEDALQSTVGQVASFISIITSTGSVIIGLLLLRQHRVNSQEDARDAHTHLNRYLSRTGNTQRLAVLYSIPYAFLMWAMISFAVAISWECFNGGNHATIAMCTVAFFLVFALILWCAYSGTRSVELTRNVILNPKDYLTKSIRSLVSHVTFSRRNGHGHDVSQAA